jgi:hypothetical protein
VSNGRLPSLIGTSASAVLIISSSDACSGFGSAAHFVELLDVGLYDARRDGTRAFLDRKGLSPSFGYGNLGSLKTIVLDSLCIKSDLN